MTTASPSTSASRALCCETNHKTVPTDLDDSEAPR